jgi:tetratricopeptide (TPR) repeat protein
MPQSVTVLRVFLASPSGLEEERAAFRRVLFEHAEIEALEHRLLFQPVCWETAVPGIGRPQALINQDLRTCDCFVLALWDRWGSAPDTSGRYSAGSEEEFELALACHRDPALPMRQLAVFFKAVDPARLSDPEPQLQQVLAFKKRLDESKALLFATFDDVQAFQHHVRRLLAHWRRDHQGRSVKDAPVQGLTAATTLRAPAESMSILQADSEDNTVAAAERLANQGRLTDAEALFARAILRRTDVHALSRYGQFLVRLGRLAQAEVIYEQILRVAGSGEDRWLSEAYGNLGLIHRTKGQLAAATDAVRRALAIDERTSRTDDLAIHYGFLGLIYRTRGDLTGAERLHQQALEIEQAAGRLEGIAAQYGNLGVVHQMRGDLDRAEAAQREALKVAQRLDHAEGVANAYGNLGVIALQRGDLEEAESLLQEALSIDRRLGRLEGMANHYGHLGALHRIRANPKAAEEMLNRALEINEQLGRLKGQAENYSEIALVRSGRGDLDGAERLLRKALGLDEELGRVEGMATRYAQLAEVYRLREDLAPARALLQRAQELHRRAGESR